MLSYGAVTELVRWVNVRVGAGGGESASVSGVVSHVLVFEALIGHERRNGERNRRAEIRARLDKRVLEMDGTRREEGAWRS